MVRNTGDFQYKKEAESEIMNCLHIAVLRTTNLITKMMRKNFSKTMHPSTILRILNKLESEGKIKSIEAGRAKLWQKK